MQQSSNLERKHAFARPGNALSYCVAERSLRNPRRAQNVERGSAEVNTESDGALAESADAGSAFAFFPAAGAHVSWPPRAVRAEG